MAGCYDQLRQLSQAIAAYRRALAVRDSNGEWWYRSGRLELDSGNRAEATRSLVPGCSATPRRRSRDGAPMHIACKPMRSDSEASVVAPSNTTNATSRSHLQTRSIATMSAALSWIWARFRLGNSTRLRHASSMNIFAAAFSSMTSCICAASAAPRDGRLFVQTKRFCPSCTARRMSDIAGESWKKSSVSQQSMFGGPDAERRSPTRLTSDYMLV